MFRDSQQKALFSGFVLVGVPQQSMTTTHGEQCIRKKLEQASLCVVMKDIFTQLFWLQLKSCTTND